VIGLKELFVKYYKPISMTFEEKQEYFKYLNIASIETKDNLKDMILNYISGEDVNIEYLQNEISQIIIEHYQGQEINKDYYNFLSFLRDNTGKNNSYTKKIYKNFTNIDEWRNVIEIYARWQNVNDYSSLGIDGGFSSREKMIAKVSNELRQYKIDIRNGKFILDNNKLQKIQIDIENLIKKIGAKYCLEYIFKQLGNKYDSILQRYLFPKQFTRFDEEPKLDTPFNFLINISLKYMKEEGKRKYQTQKYLDKLFNLSSRYIFLYDLQDFHNMNKNSFPQHWSIETLYQNILYDNLFRFKQISIHNINFIIKNLFKDYSKFEKKLGFTLDDYLKLIDKIYYNPNYSMVTYPSDIFSKEEKQILNLLSHCYKDINQAYDKPQNFTKINFTEKPLIKLEDSYLLIDKNYCSWGFYEIILKALCYPDIGISLENLIYARLDNQNYKLYNGKYFNSKKEKGECDIVIETKEKIIFIEVKKKAITTKALEGDEVKITEDIIDSFMHSQEQILKHEYSIKLDKKIEFEDSSVLELNDKDIVKVSLSLFDNYMLNDKMMALNMFEFFQKIRFSNPTKELEKKNSKIENIIQKLDEIYKNNPQEYRKNRYDIYFISLELFLYYLDINKPIDEVLQDIRQVSFSTGDLYYEYIELMKIKNYKGKM